ncbi:MAG: M48 family metallopeptidase [Solirubrobacteraceae bacterium]
MQTLDYHIRSSQRARRIRVTVDPARGVEVVLPAATFRRGTAAAEREAAAAVTALRPWIERRVGELERVRISLAAWDGTVPYLGQRLRLAAEAGRTRVHRREDVLHVPAGEPGRAALERWYRRQAQAEITPRLERACAITGHAYSKLTIRAQRTRWASCSRSGAMSFNWRLLLGPEPVLDYVVWHEVCHLQVMDHSRRFWALLRSHCPDFQEQQHWLRRHGTTLTLQPSSWPPPVVVP